MTDMVYLPNHTWEFSSKFPSMFMEIFATLLGDVNNETIGHANLKNRSERTESLKRK